MIKTIKNIFLILNKGEKRKLLRLAAADIIINILDISFLVLLLVVINFYTGNGNSGSFFRQLPFLNKHPLFLITAFFLLFTLKNIAGFLVFRAEYRFVYLVASRLSGDSLMNYLRGSFSEYVHTDSSVFFRKINQQPVEFCHYIVYGMLQIFSQLMLILITAVAILIFNPVLFPLLILVLAPPVTLIAFLMKKKLASVRAHGKKVSEKSIQHLQEALAGYTESNIYGKNDFFKERYHSFQSRLNQYLAEKQVIQNMPSRLIEVFAVLGLFSLILLHSIAGNSGALSIITIGSFIAAAYKIIPGIVRVMNTFSQVRTYEFTMSDLLSNGEPRPEEKRYTTPVQDIEFRNICFSYPGKNVISSFSVHLRMGDLAGISGISGKGKTTLVNLLLGFLAPDSGSILINGTPASSRERRKYRGRISYSKQQPFFIHDTVLKNITLTDAPCDKEKLNRILAATGIDQFTVSGKTPGNDIITEHGKNLSGGQRQRIIFARSLYNAGDLLILDEPFSELDKASEQDMLGILQQLAEAGKIIILISHNEEALSFCNKRIFADEVEA